MIESHEGSRLADLNPLYDTHQKQGEVAVEIVINKINMVDYTGDIAVCG
jgi:hypothetical protein